MDGCEIRRHPDVPMPRVLPRKEIHPLMIMAKAKIVYKKDDLVLAVVKVREHITSDTKTPKLEILSIHEWDLETLKEFTAVVLANNLNEAQNVPIIDAGTVSSDTKAIIDKLKNEDTPEN